MSSVVLQQPELGVSLSGIIPSESTVLMDSAVNFISQLAISPDGLSLISGGCAGKAILWDLVNDKGVTIFQHRNDVVMNVVTNDFKILASSSYNGTEIGRMGYDTMRTQESFYGEFSPTNLIGLHPWLQSPSCHSRGTSRLLEDSLGHQILAS